jgi:FMN reductase [NAD(P)H]
MACRGPPTPQYYQNVYFPEVAPVARKQGFGFDR